VKQKSLASFIPYIPAAFDIVVPFVLWNIYIMCSHLQWPRLLYFLTPHVYIFVRIFVCLAMCSGLHFTNRFGGKTFTQIGYFVKNFGEVWLLKHLVKPTPGLRFTKRFGGKPFTQIIYFVKNFGEVWLLKHLVKPTPDQLKGTICILHCLYITQRKGAIVYQFPLYTGAQNVFSLL